MDTCCDRGKNGIYMIKIFPFICFFYFEKIFKIMVNMTKIEKFIEKKIFEISSASRFKLY